MKELARAWLAVVVLLSYLGVLGFAYHSVLDGRQDAKEDKEGQIWCHKKSEELGIPTIWDKERDGCYELIIKPKGSNTA